MDNFGVLFGRLVREKRGIEGLSQDQLAGKSDLTKARISELENGKISNPHTKTVDALCVALGITREERAACYSSLLTQLPPAALQRLALQFGAAMPDATEEELEAFLTRKADDLNDLRVRIREFTDISGRILDLMNAADKALEEGDFDAADEILKKAEDAQLEAITVPALKTQARLRIERGNAALVMSNITKATDFFEHASCLFSDIDVGEEAKIRHDCSDLLRAYGYRYRSTQALYAARDGLSKILGICKKDEHIKNWCKSKNALGGVGIRLAQFDIPENAMMHLTKSQEHYRDVRSHCSADFLQEYFATAGANMASVYSDRRMARNEDEYRENLLLALELLQSSLSIVKRLDDRDDSLLHHNLAVTYIDLSSIRNDKEQSISDLRNAISHAEYSLEARDPLTSLQYWVASCRTLGDALLCLAIYVNDDLPLIQRASNILRNAASRISSTDHPHQWIEIQDQISRCG